MRVWKQLGGQLGGRIRSRTMVAAAMLAAVASVTVAPREACAQRARMSANAGGFSQTPVTTRELEKWVSILNLSGEQKEAVKTLHQAYQTEFQAESKALQDVVKSAQQEFMESQDTGAFKDVAEKSAKHSDKMTALDRQFMDDVKAILDPKQAEQFPKVERHHRRTKSLPSSMLSGEGANLVTVIEDLGLNDASPELKDALEQYEIDLDKALVDRDAERKTLEKQSQEMMKDFDPSKMDFTKIRQLMQDTRKTGVKVRDTNKTYARRLENLVPAAKQAEYQDKVRKALYPSVYRDTYTSKALAAAEGFDDLTSEQKANLGSIRESYQRELASVNDKWAAAIADEEKDGGGDPFMGFGKFVPGGDPNEKPSPTEESKKARRELDKTNLEKIKAFLTDAQKERLPERKEENPWMMNFGGDGDADADEKPAKASKPDRKK